MPPTDRELRAIALGRLDELIDQLGPALTRSELQNVLTGVPTPHLVDRQKGIWNPKWLDATLSVLTMPEHSYADRELASGIWAYSYRAGTAGGDNKKLKLAKETGVDIIYFRPLSPTLYEPIYPVRVMETDDDRREAVLVRLDIDRVDWSVPEAPERVYLRSWRERIVLEREHQGGFRKRVMKAYEHTCAVCRLQYEELLDAAHIDSDRSEFGEPVIENGLALCKIHHRAFDAHLLGITPGYRVEIRGDVLEARDGPMLQHGLQGMHGVELRLPRDPSQWPTVPRLESRFETFRSARVAR